MMRVEGPVVIVAIRSSFGPAGFLDRGHVDLNLAGRGWLVPEHLHQHGVPVSA